MRVLVSKFAGFLSHQLIGLAGLLCVLGIFTSCSPTIDPSVLLSSSVITSTTTTTVSTTAVTLTAISPSAGSTVGNVLLTLTGTGFVPGMGVTIGGYSCLSVTYISSGSVTCLTPALAAGTIADVVVNTGLLTTTLSASYTATAPVINAVIPTSVASAGGNLITITGSYFASGATVQIGTTSGGYVACSSPVVTSSTTILCQTAASTVVGAKNIVVTNTDLSQATLALAITYSAPLITSVSPATGTTLGGTPVTISGNYFSQGATVKIGVGTAATLCTPVVVISSTTITCRTGTAAVPGPTTVTVTNADSQIANFISGYSYIYPPLSVAYGTPLAYTVGNSATPASPGPSGTSGVTYTVSPALPGGLSLNSSTGVISGSPTGPASRGNYTVIAANGVGSLTRVITISVTDFGDGSDSLVSDGTSAVTSSPNQVNSGEYGYVTNSSVPVGTTVVSVDSSTGTNLRAGNEILIVQMQSNNSQSNHHWEFNKIQTIISGTPTTLILSYPLGYSYTSGTRNASASVVTQVVRVRHYTSTTLNYSPYPWTPGSGIGGVLVTKVKGTATLASGFSATGLGFRGGAAGNSGESWKGVGTSGGNGANGGGGSGGFGGAYGSSSGTTTSDGATYGVSSLIHLLMGAGGGGNSGTGGVGGGILFLLADTINMGGININSSGCAAGGSGISCSGSAGDGGGGAGGSIYLVTNSLIGTTAISAAGGSGTHSGGGGRIRIDTNYSASSIPGVSNLLTAGSTYYGFLGTTNANFGTGADGSINLSSGTLYPATSKTPLAAGAAPIANNFYTYMTDTTAVSGATSLTVDKSNNASFSVAKGDEILILQTQNTAPTPAWEFVRVQDYTLATGLITLASPLVNSYLSGYFNLSSSQITQVIRVPQYMDVTIGGGTFAAPPWNDGTVYQSTGGVIAFRATGTVKVANGASISAKGTGFRGGAGKNNSSQTSAQASQGESWYGLGSSATTYNYGGGGGATGSGISASSGGGGGYASLGGAALVGPTVLSSSWLGTGGLTYGNNLLSYLFFGSGGGGDVNTNTGVTLKGGQSGGGIILIAADTLSLNGPYGIDARGVDSILSTGGSSGGAGAGGSIFLMTHNFFTSNASDPTVCTSALSTSACLIASGGAGTTFAKNFGGNGRIRLDYNYQYPITPVVNPPLVANANSAATTNFSNIKVSLPQIQVLSDIAGTWGIQTRVCGGASSPLSSAGISSGTYTFNADGTGTLNLLYTATNQLEMIGFNAAETATGQLTLTNFSSPFCSTSGGPITACGTSGVGATSIVFSYTLSGTSLALVSAADSLSCTIGTSAASSVATTKQ